MRDILSNFQEVHLGNVTVSGTTPATSGYVDLQGFGACNISVVANTVTDAGTAAGFTVTLQESADTTAAAASTVATTDTVGESNTVTVTSDSADDSTAGRMGYLGSNRYVGITVTGTTGSNADISIIATLGKPTSAAVTAIGTAVART